MHEFFFNDIMDQHVVNIAYFLPLF